MIITLQGLRSLATIGIFLFHAGLLIKGTFPVTFFFILSGFVLYYSYSKKINTITIKENILWVKKRMKKMYLIHIVTFIMSIFIRWNWIVSLEKIELLKKATINLLLLQSLTMEPFTFNGLTWFLSAIFILYLIALPLIIVIKKYIKINPIYIVVLLLVIENIIVYINNIEGYGWSLYSSPFFRVFDFSIGMVIAKIFMESEINKNRRGLYNIYESMIVLGFMIMYIFTIVSNEKIEYGLSYYSWIFAIALYIFAIGKGIISKMLSNNLLQKISLISFEFYMVHELILIIFRKVFSGIKAHWLLTNIIISIPSLIISLILAIIFNKYITNIKKNKVNISKKLISS